MWKRDKKERILWSPVCHRPLLLFALSSKKNLCRRSWSFFLFVPAEVPGSWSREWWYPHFGFENRCMVFLLVNLTKDMHNNNWPLSDTRASVRLDRTLLSLTNVVAGMMPGWILRMNAPLLVDYQNKDWNAQQSCDSIFHPHSTMYTHPKSPNNHKRDGNWKMSPG